MMLLPTRLRHPRPSTDRAYGATSLKEATESLEVALPYHPTNSLCDVLYWPRVCHYDPPTHQLCDVRN
eukprot:2275830-Rhodomonas_salina.1